MYYNYYASPNSLGGLYGATSKVIQVNLDLDLVLVILQSQSEYHQDHTSLGDIKNHLSVHMDLVLT